MARLLRMFLTAGQRSDYIGARALLEGLTPAEHMLADSVYDADWYREALEDKGISPCIPSRKGRKVPIPHDEVRYRKRHKIENSLAGGNVRQGRGHTDTARVATNAASQMKSAPNSRANSSSLDSVSRRAKLVALDIMMRPETRDRSVVISSVKPSMKCS